jgi:plastocyanin
VRALLVRPTTAGVALAVAALALAGCGGGGSSSEGPTTTGGCRSVEQGRVTITARDLSWDTPCLLASVGSEVILKVVNDDKGVNHDLHLTDAPGDPKTPLSTGPSTHQLEVALPRGTYHYVCDVHPAMVGVLRVG